MASNGIEGFKLMLKNQVDVVLCDLEMPNIDGFKFLTLLQSKTQFNEIPILMLTGNEDIGAKVKALSAGASDYLTKPFHDEELVARVKVHIKIKMLQDELREKNKCLEELSNTDGLTKVANRRYLMELTELEFMRAQRYQTWLAFVMCDLDHFKALNDRHGHQVGDHALITVATILREGLRKPDIVGRYGGEEFALILPETNTEGAIFVAERYRTMIEDIKFTSTNEPLKLTASFGVVGYPNPDIDSVDALIRKADEALYAAKEAGRNCVVAARSENR